MKYQTQMAHAFENVRVMPSAHGKQDVAASAIIAGIRSKTGTFTRQGWTSNLLPETFKKFQKEGIPVSEKQAAQAA